MRDPAAFLIQPAGEGYPTDYLLARLRHRRGNLASARSSAGAIDEALGQLLQHGPAVTPLQARATMHREFRWVYLQMNRELRVAFAPFFLWFELRTIVICLRHLRAGEREQSAERLSESLMGVRLQGALTSTAPPFAAAGPLAELAGADARQARELEGWYRERKGREYEQRLIALYLEQSTRQRLHPALQDFFSLTVDLKNLVAAAKQLRWGVFEPSPLIAGGKVSRVRLEQLLKQRDEAGLLGLLPRFPDQPTPQSVPEKLEHLLLAHLTRELRRHAADRLGAGFILAYLWECYLQSLNSALAHHAGTFGTELLSGEQVP